MHCFFFDNKYASVKSFLKCLYEYKSENLVSIQTVLFSYILGLLFLIHLDKFSSI